MKPEAAVPEAVEAVVCPVAAAQPVRTASARKRLSSSA